MDDEDLRPEFVTQFNRLRTRIFNKVKPKMLNNKILTGEMLCELSISYAEAINKGKLPNI